MSDYTLAVGTSDPHGFSAMDDQAAIRYAVGYIDVSHADDLATTPQDVVTLLGVGGLITRPAERLDEFVRRLPGDHPGIDPETLQPGDANTPDCNGA